MLNYLWQFSENSNSAVFVISELLWKIKPIKIMYLDSHCQTLVIRNLKTWDMRLFEEPYFESGSNSIGEKL